jgi:C4-dicarboxylate-specific signal transduction histidine kinase
MAAPPPRPEADVPGQLERLRRRLLHELTFRAALAAGILVFDVALEPTGPGGSPLVRGTALTALLLNPVYYLAARRGRGRRAQAHGRMLADIAMITVGLHAAGGLAAAPYLAVYASIPLYAGLVLSSAACLVAAGAATLCYLALALAQQVGWLPTPRPVAPNAWVVVSFNLLMVNVFSIATATLAEGWRRSRLELAAAHRELERAHDASQQLNAEIQRAGQLRLLGEVVAGVAHELRNVLTVALGHLGLMRRHPEEIGPETKRHVDRIETSLEAAMAIVGNALQTARPPAAELGPVSLGEIAERVLGLKAYDLRRDGVAAVVDFPPGLPAVRGAAFQLQQVLLNLVTNAQHALAGAPPPRRIVISGRAERSDVIVEVSDTGPGIAPDALPRLFEAFFTTRPAGTGLGLAISAGIVRDLGGRLTAENRAEGGARFRICLPAAG